MTIRRTLLASLALAAGALVAAPHSLLADGDKGKDGKGAQKEKVKDEDKAEWKECAAVGRDFAAKRSSAISDRVRGSGKINIVLTDSGDYSREQVVDVLDKWFKDKKDLTAEMKAISELTGTLDVSWRRDGSDKPVKGKLYVTLQRRKGGGFFLTKLVLST